MPYKVFHLNHDLSPFMFQKAYIVANVKTFWSDRNRLYTHVADVIAFDLEEVFDMTNSGAPNTPEEGWGFREGVCVRTANNLRSTSVGDVVVDPQGKAWCCAIVGWEELQ